MSPRSQSIESAGDSKPEVKKYHQYDELLVWQKGIDVAEHMYQLTVPFPEEELHGLTQQLRQTALSIPVQIATGFELRFSNRQVYLTKLRLALAAIAQLETQLVVARRLAIADQEDAQLTADLLSLKKMIFGMLKVKKSTTLREEAAV
jgi:four helix bundle protein